VTCWPAVRLQVYNYTGWPLTAAPPRTSRHNPSVPMTSPEVGFEVALPIKVIVCAAATGNAGVTTVTVTQNRRREPLTVERALRFAI
jgi:hypothetical protein